MNEHSNAQLLRVLKQLQAAAGVDDSHWASVLGLTPAQYQRVVTRHREVPLVALTSITERFHLDFESVYQGQIDFMTAAAHFHGKIEEVPECYRNVPFHWKWMLGHHVNFVAKKRGWIAASRVLRKLQVHEAAVGPAGAQVNIRLFKDFTQLLEANGADTREFEEIGHSLAGVFGNDPSLKLPHGIRSAAELYEILIWNVIGLKNGNCHYRIEGLSPSVCAVYTKVKPEIQEALGLENSGSRGLCHQKAGLFSALPERLGYRRARVVKTGCQHSGDSQCRYLIQWDPKIAMRLYC